MNMMKHLPVVVVVLAAVAMVNTVPPPTCETSFDCDAGECCMDRNGNSITFDHPDHSVITGTCITTQAKANDFCSYECQCTAGYICFRPISDFNETIRHPSRCWSQEAADENKANWNIRNLGL